MEDENFHKFRESIEHQRDFDVDEQAWSNLSNRLDLDKKPSLISKLFSWKMLSLAGLIVLLSSNLLLRRNLSEIQNLNKQLLTERSIKTTDTVVVEKWNTIFDTITKYKTTPSRKNTSIIPYFSSYQPSFISDFVWKYHFNLLSEAMVNDIDSSMSHVRNKHFGTWNSEILPIANIKRITYRKRLFYPTPRTSQLFSLNAGPTKIQRASYFARPKGFYFGGDFLFNIPFSKDFKRQENSGIGLRLEVPFTEQVVFWGSLSGHFTEYSSNFIPVGFEKDNIEIPSHFKFLELNIIQKYKQLMAGFKYNFESYKKCTPFLSLGYGITRKMETQLLYNFVDKVDGSPLLVKRERPVADFEIKNMIQMGAGFNWKYSNRLHFQSQIGYMLIANDENVFYKSGLNVGIGILYRL